MIVRAVWLSAALLPLSCTLVSDKLEDAADCAAVCTAVEQCGVTPPAPEFGALGGATGSGGLDCALSCAADDRELRGYSDCQMQCLAEATCETMADCWRPRSDLYLQYCLADREIPPVAPSGTTPAPGNGSVTGNEEVDIIVSDPSVAIAVQDAEDEGFTVNFGDQPPQLVGKYDVSGVIDASSNARPEGSPILTSICFWDWTEGPGGVTVSYCEDGVPGEDSAPLTGNNDAFTAWFEYPGQATVMFSGSVNPDGTLSQVEALVVYTYATDVWELSHTDWRPDGACTSCSP